MLRLLLIISTLFVFNVSTPISSLSTLKDNTVILPNLPYCGPNSKSTPCGDPCQRYCGLRKPRYCTGGCIINGCVCIPGYIRRDENGPCIPETWCRIAAEKWDSDDYLYFRIYDD